MTKNVQCITKNVQYWGMNILTGTTREEKKRNRWGQRHGEQVG